MVRVGVWGGGGGVCGISCNLLLPLALQKVNIPLLIDNNIIIHDGFSDNLGTAGSLSIYFYPA